MEMTNDLQNKIFKFSVQFPAQSQSILLHNNIHNND